MIGPLPVDSDIEGEGTSERFVELGFHTIYISVTFLI
jgi:hypothetical protein